MSDRVIKFRKSKVSVTPVTNHKPLSKSDAMLIQSLSKDFIESGALENDRVEELKAAEDFQDIFREAAAAAQTEKDTNPEFYSEYADSMLVSRATYMDEFENPSLDGIDDYGRQIYKNNLTEQGLPKEIVYVDYTPIEENTVFDENVITEEEYADEVEGKSTFEALEETMEKKGVSSPFAGGIQNKSVDAKPFQRIDFTAVKSQPPKMLQHKKDIDPEARPTEPLDEETLDLYAKAFSKARLPNGGLI